MEFSFDENSSLLSTCKHAASETVRVLEASDRAIVVSSKIYCNVCASGGPTRPLSHATESPTQRCAAVVCHGEPNPAAAISCHGEPNPAAISCCKLHARSPPVGAETQPYA